MNKSKKTTNEITPGNNPIPCRQCGSIMKKVSWRITAGAFDAGKEVEQTVYQCSKDKNFLSIEVSTGNKSEFAAEYDDEPLSFSEY